MKKIFLLLTVIILILSVTAAFAEQVSLTTYFAAPIGAYDRLRLVPINELTGACASGELYVETPDILHYCVDDGSGNGTGNWGLLSGTWTELNNNIYLTDTNSNPNLFVGIGTSTPQSRLHIHDPNMTVNWTDANSYFTAGETLYQHSDVIIDSTSTRLLMTGEDESSNLASIRMVEVNAAGNYVDQWNIMRCTSNDVALSGIRFSIGYKTIGPIAWSDRQNQKLSILPDGKVGIGTSGKPLESLHIGGDGYMILEDDDVSIEFKDTAAGDPDFRVISNTNNTLKIQGKPGAGWEEMLAVKSDGNVGIGTSDPLGEIHLNKNNFTTPINWGSSVNHGLLGDLIISGQDNTLTLIGADHSDCEAIVQFSEVDAAGDFTNRWQLGRGATSSAVTKGNFYIGYSTKTDTFNPCCKNALQKFVITPNGNVGIDTNDPQYDLHIKGDACLRLEDASTGFHFIDTTGPDFILKTWQNSLYIKRSPTGEDIMRLLSNGNVGIKQLNPQYKLHVNGNLHASGGFIDTSDARLKKDVVPIKNALEKIDMLNAVNYCWVDEERGTGPHFGLIAHEVEKAFPAAASEDNDGYRAVAYGRLTSVIVEAIKELNNEASAKIETLKKESTLLESTSTQQQGQIEKLKKMFE